MTRRTRNDRRWLFVVGGLILAATLVATAGVAAADGNESRSPAANESAALEASVVAYVDSYDDTYAELVFSEPVAEESLYYTDEVVEYDGETHRNSAYVFENVGDRRFVVDLPFYDTLDDYDKRLLGSVALDVSNVTTLSGGESIDVDSVPVTTTHETIHDGSDPIDESDPLEVFQGETIAFKAEEPGRSIEVEAVDGGYDETIVFGNVTVATFDTSEVEPGTTLAFDFGNETHHVRVLDLQFESELLEEQVTVNEDVRLRFESNQFPLFRVTALDEDGVARERTYGSPCWVECRPYDVSFRVSVPGNYTVEVAHPVTGQAETLPLEVTYFGPELVSGPTEVFGTVALEFTEPIETDDLADDVTLYVDGDPYENVSITASESDGRLEIETDREFDGTESLSIDATAAETGVTNEIREVGIDRCSTNRPPQIDRRWKPMDLNGDGLYEDLDGSESTGSNDVILFFQHLETDSIQDHACNYDFNGSGGVGFDDVIALFNRI